jgi:sugar phosphate isomerase/epimerase
VKNDAALGDGLMDLPAILKAAKAAGVKYYSIEDESP